MQKCSFNSPETIRMFRVSTAGVLCPSRWLIQVLFIIGALLILTQVLFLHNSTIQILPRVFLPNSYTYIDRSSVLYKNDNKILVLRKEKSDKIYRQQATENKDKSKKDPTKSNKNKTKTDQYIIYKFNDSAPSYQMKDFMQKSILFQHLDEKTSFYNGNISIHNPNPMSYHTVFGSPIYLTSVHGRYGVEPENMTFYNASNKLYMDSISYMSGFYNMPLTRTVNFISITGWMHDSLLQEDLKCCLLLKNQSVVSYLNRRRMIWYQVKKQPLFATKSYCPIPPELRSEKPIGASLSLPPYDCYLRIFMKIQYPEIRKRNSLAFCAKIAYGALPADRLIEWLETQRFIGVDKVMIYYYNLNSDAMNVLNTYMKEGLVDLQPFDFPQPDDPVRHVGEKAAQPFIDEQVAVYDCIERLKGYNYVGIIDFDEFIYSRISYKHNLKALLTFLARRYPNASGFSFMTEIFITDWADRLNSIDSQYKLSRGNQFDSHNSLWHSRYLNRTAPMTDRVKNIINMERVVIDSIWTHNYTSLPGYKKYKISSSLGCLKHFRSCREKWVEDGKCFKLRKYRDRTIADLMNNINNTILEKKKALINN